MNMTKRMIQIIITLILSFIMAACSKPDATSSTLNSATQGTPKITSKTDTNLLKDSSKDEFEWKYYGNPRFNYGMSYPDIFDETIQPDNSDGVTLKSDDGKYELIMWGSYNVLEYTPQTFVDFFKEDHTDCSEVFLDGNSYSITSVDKVDGKLIQTVQKGYVLPDKSVHYQLSYPVTEKENFLNVNIRMTSELDFND